MGHLRFEFPPNLTEIPPHESVYPNDHCLRAHSFFGRCVRCDNGVPALCRSARHLRRMHADDDPGRDDDGRGYTARRNERDTHDGLPRQAGSQIAQIRCESPAPSFSRTPSTFAPATCSSSAIKAFVGSDAVLPRRPAAWSSPFQAVGHFETKQGSAR